MPHRWRHRGHLRLERVPAQRERVQPRRAQLLQGLRPAARAALGSRLLRRGLRLPPVLHPVARHHLLRALLLPHQRRLQLMQAQRGPLRSAEGLLAPQPPVHHYAAAALRDGLLRVGLLHGRPAGRLADLGDCRRGCGVRATGARAGRVPRGPGQGADHGHQRAAGLSACQLWALLFRHSQPVPYRSRAAADGAGSHRGGLPG
mmetsp:Transcript_31295/g.80883  ORF Transcript_31295/g.80883 Transcript_31295/m.80883 type:complete len:203 (-) Transcript_31295:2193-2801(-)